MREKTMVSRNEKITNSTKKEAEKLLEWRRGTRKVPERQRDRRRVREK